MFNDRILEDKYTLSDYFIKPNYNLDLLIITE